jgi:glycosyltransferase involved in cell wall biosynthesis
VEPKAKILHFADYSPDFSGSFVETLEGLTLSLKEQQIDSVLVFPIYKKWQEVLQKKNINIEIFPSPNFSRPITVFKLLVRLKKIINRYNSQIVHCHFSRNYLIFIILYKYLFQRNLRIVWHWHNPPATLIGASNNYIKLIFRNQFYKVLSKLIDMHIAISSEIYNWLSSFCKNVAYIPNGISLKKFDVSSFDKTYDIRDEFKISKDCSIICSVANFRPQKDYHTLLEAAKRVIDKMSNTFFIFVGDGPTRSDIEKLSCKLKINNNVIFTGTRKDVEKVIFFSDIFVLSTNFEGLPYVLCEAMALSKPVVATNVIGCRDMVKDNSGILTKPYDSRNLADSLLKLLSNKEIAGKMGKKGRKIVESQFTLEKQIESIIKIYKTLS